MKNKIYTATIFVLITLLLYFIYENIHLNSQLQTKPSETKQVSINEVTDNIQVKDENKNVPEIDYEEYSKIFDYMANNLKLNHFEYKDGDTIPGVVVVDKDLTFNKRKVLNLTDEINTAESKSTQKLLIYENKELNKQITIIFSYIPYYIESNMINCLTPWNYDKTTQQLSEKSCMSTVNYKNIIITITETSINKSDIQDVFMVIRNVQEFLDKEF